MYHGAVSRRSGLSWILAALCIAGLVNVRSDVAADVGSLVVGRGPIFPGCPPGSREARGGYCVEDACDSTEPLRRDGRTYTCGLLRVCTEVREVVRYDWMAAFVWEERDTPGARCPTTDRRPTPHTVPRTGAHLIRPRRRGLGRRPITAPGGAAGDVYAAGPTGVVHWNGRRWQNVVRVTRTRSDAFTSICATRTHVFIAETRSAVIPARVWMRPRRNPEGER